VLIAYLIPGVHDPHRKGARKRRNIDDSVYLKIFLYQRRNLKPDSGHNRHHRLTHGEDTDERSLVTAAENLRIKGFRN
jgi:hypothetical protein